MVCIEIGTGSTEWSLKMYCIVDMEREIAEGIFLTEFLQNRSTNAAVIVK